MNGGGGVTLYIYIFSLHVNMSNIFHFIKKKFSNLIIIQFFLLN